ncbi:MAG: hypothetical protein KDA42_15770, partial [Planctomycetales bacterium]|nr:hypothetical protein [Planctomycetales bacterium]
MNRLAVVVSLASFVALVAQPLSASLVQANIDASSAASGVDLLETSLSGAATLTGTWTNEGVTGAPGALTNGAAIVSAGYVASGSTFGAPSNGSTVTFDLDTSTKVNGYRITQIDFF